MSIGIGNLLNMFLHNGETNTVKAGVLHRSDPPQAILVESEADLEHLGEVPAGSIAYTAGYSSMWQLSAAGSWEEIQEEGGGSGGGGGLVVHLTKNDGVFYADHTAGEIIDAADTGAVISIITVMDGVMSIALLTRIENYLDDVEAPGVSFTFSAGSRTTELTAVSADSYPSYEDGQS